MQEGHEHNLAGAFYEAYECFHRCYSIGGRIEARLSGANMLAKSGRLSDALQEYDQMLALPAEETELVCDILERKHAEVSRALQVIDAATAEENPEGAPAAGELDKGSVSTMVRKASGDLARAVDASLGRWVCCTSRSCNQTFRHHA